MRRLGAGSWWAIGFILEDAFIPGTVIGPKPKIRVYGAGFVLDVVEWIEGRY